MAIQCDRLDALLQERKEAQARVTEFNRLLYNTPATERIWSRGWEDRRNQNVQDLIRLDELVIEIRLLVGVVKVLRRLAA